MNKFGNFSPFAFQGSLLASGNIPAASTVAGSSVGNVDGVDQVQRVLAGFSTLMQMPGFKEMDPTAKGHVFNSFAQAAQPQIDIVRYAKEQRIGENEKTQMLIEAQKEAAAQANQWGKENLKIANEMNRSNSVLNTLLQMPGQISDSWARAATAGLPYQQEARQMMANTGANLLTGYTNLANLNSQAANQVTNLFSNAAAYRPTLIAGKYF